MRRLVKLSKEEILLDMFPKVGAKASMEKVLDKTKFKEAKYVRNALTKFRKTIGVSIRILREEKVLIRES